MIVSTDEEFAMNVDGNNFAVSKHLLVMLRDLREVVVPTSKASSVAATSLLNQLKILSLWLWYAGHLRESETLKDVHSLCTLPTDFGGLGLNATAEPAPEEEQEIYFLVSAWLETLNSEDRCRSPNFLLPSRPEGRRGMTLAEKILSMHDIEKRGSVKPGDMVRVSVDWVMASESSWAGMRRTYDKLGSPGIVRNDRFWLAGDHVVDPRINHDPEVSRLIEASEKAKKDFKMTDYQGMNYTIMHTEFYRERAQPGMIVIGSDSHTCSAGALGCLAIGLGAADATMPLVTGETWFRVPETVKIHFVNAPSPGIGGKDTILYILKELKRNTVAADRIIEFTGPGLRHLSCDARFAIANMTTEFGGITGVFVADQLTHDFINRRRTSRHKSSAHFFYPDDDAKYCATYEIDLSLVESFVALYPSPDDVVPVGTIEGKDLDGCFIGACTTAEEDLILAALVLEQGLKKGLAPLKKGKRKVVPGSRPILNKLRTLGLVDVYEQAGFEVGIPGCSYCVGMGADRAGEGEVWLSSQNRNFENRMGKGSIGNIASAATVAASSFEMKITNPKSLLASIDPIRYTGLSGQSQRPLGKSGPVYVEPGQAVKATKSNPQQTLIVPSLSKSHAVATTKDVIRGKIQRLGDFVDTDALAPSRFLITSRTTEAIGAHCLEYTHPQFRRRVRDGFNIVVAGDAFGCGSSREQAVLALLGCGVTCVIAKSFSFIFGRNLPALGLLGITITSKDFYDTSQDGMDITVDLDRQFVSVGGKNFAFELSQMERELHESGGITSAFHKYGSKLFEVMCAPEALSINAMVAGGGSCGVSKPIEW